MSLSRIVMRLARNPGTEFAGGDDHRGYTLTAPLTADGYLDEAAYAQQKADCTVRRFAPDEDAAEGRLARKGSVWFFDYDEGDTADDEPFYRLGDHRLGIGGEGAGPGDEGRALGYKGEGGQGR